jgi:hypothetical protein
MHNRIQKKHKANFPSGLVHNWQSRISAGTQGLSSKATVVAYSGNNIVTVGGLNDEDACADMATTLALNLGNRNMNDVCCRLCQQRLKHTD